MAVVGWDLFRSIFVFDHVIKAFIGRELGLKDVVEIEIQYLPKEIEFGSREHALFLFFGACLNRFGVDSDKLIRDMAKLFVEYPQLFDPLSDYRKDDLQKLLPLMPFTSDLRAQTALNFPGLEPSRKGFEEAKQRLKDWVFNRVLLERRYAGDPRNILCQAERSRQGLIKAFTDFRGIGAKIAQLAIIWFQEVAWQDKPKLWEKINTIAVMPVDVWVLRLVRQAELVTAWSTPRKDPLIEVISECISNICQFHPLDHSPKYSSPHIELSQALWHIGAKICFGKPKNSSPEKLAHYCATFCPLNDFCTCIVPASDYKYFGTTGWDNVTLRPTEFSDQTLF